MATLPEFKSNLGVDVQGRGIVSGSGQRAQARATNSFVDLLDRVSEQTTQRIAEEQRRRAASGEFDKDELPSAMTTIGRATREGYAESQALKVNMEIRNKVAEITSQEGVGTDVMAQQIQGASEAMIGENIPELSDYISKSFTSFGASDINSISKKRLKNQRASITRSIEESEKFASDAFIKDFGLSRVAEDEIVSIQNRLSSGDITEKQAADLIAEVDEGAVTRAANAEASLREALTSRVKNQDISEQEAEILFKRYQQKARDEYITQLSLRKGLHVINDFNLSTEEKSSIMTRYATIANIENSAADREEREMKDNQNRIVQSEIQIITNDIYDNTDPAAVDQKIARLRRLNESIGSSDIRKQLDTLEDRFSKFQVSGGQPNPVQFANFKRQIELGDIVSVQQLDDLGFANLNQEEQSDLVQLVNSERDERLSSAGFKAVKEQVKLRLPDDIGAPSALERALNGAKVSEEQTRIEDARNNIYDQLLDGVLTGTLVTVQQMQDFVGKSTQDALKDIYREDFNIINSHGLSVSSTDEEIFEAIANQYPDKAQANKKYKSIKRLMAKVRTQ